MESLIKDILINITEYNFNSIFIEETKDNDITETSANKNEAINNKRSEILDTVTKEIPLEKVIAPEKPKLELKNLKR